MFSKGYYSNVNCVHVPASLGQTQATFDIAMGQCGMSPGGNTDSFGSPNPQVLGSVLCIRLCADD